MSEQGSMTGEELGQKLLQSVCEMKAGNATRITVVEVEVPPMVAARRSSGLSQAQFAALLGVSVRTLQQWEQGRREPSGAAKTLLGIALRHPEWLREGADA
jgi:putative transcriptional regulator